MLMVYVQVYLVGFVLSGVIDSISVYRNRELYEEFDFTQNEINFMIIFSSFFSWLGIVTGILFLFRKDKRSKREVISELRDSLDNIYTILNMKK